MTRKKFYKYPRLVRNLLLLLADITAYAIAISMAMLLYRYYCEGPIQPEMWFHFWLMPTSFFLIGRFARIYGGNFFYGGASVDPPEELKRITLIAIGCFLILLGYYTLSSNIENFSLFSGTFSTIFVIFLIPVCRYGVRTLMKHTGLGVVPVLVAGGGKSGLMVCEELQRDRFFGYEPIGYLDDSPDNPYGINVPYLGRLSEAVYLSRSRHIDTIICCIPLPVLEAKRERWGDVFMQLIIVADTRIFPVNWSYPINFNSIAALSISNQMQWKLFRVSKFLFEVCAAFLAIIVLFTLGVLIAVLIKLTSRGPVFYYASRLGQNGKTFNVIKFRTMYKDSAQILQQMLESNAELAMEWESKFKLENDPRVTPLGRFLRRTSMDELPQFLNILRGEMALIGPRPIVKEEKKYYGEYYKFISRVKPGITGLWQVSGRSDTTYEQRVRLDLYYLNNWSIWMDYFILLKTVKEVLFCRGAK